MSSQKNIKQQSDLHADSCNPFYFVKKSCFKKILICLVIAQVLGMLYFYRHRLTNRSSHNQESSPNPKLVEDQRMGASSIFHLPLTRANDMGKYYIEVTSGVWCLNIGIKSNKYFKAKCDCLEGWKGLDCGIPPAVWNSEFIAKGAAKGVQIRRRHHPRRLIYSVVYSGELELLNYTLTYLSNIVEVFLIGEVNLSESSKLNTDLSSQFLKKIMYISITPSSLKLDSTNYLNLQKEIWMKGKNVMSDFRPDDVVIFTDIASIPSKDVLTFFKLYDGFSEPIQFNLASTDSVYNTSTMFNLPTKTTSLSSDIMACTFEYLRYLCTYDASLVWFYEQVSRKEESRQFQKNNWPLRQWVVGSYNFPAGLVCHFCVPVSNITVVSQGMLEINETKGAPLLLETNNTKVE